MVGGDMDATEQVKNQDEAILVLRQSLGQVVQLIEESWTEEDSRVGKVLGDAKDSLSMTASFDPRLPSSKTSVNDPTPTTTAEEERQKTRDRSSALD